MQRLRDSSQISTATEALEDRCLLAAFIVDTLVDESDSDFGAGDFSLREAIEQSNASGAVDDTIHFDAGLAGGTIALELGELEIDDTVTIVGLGAEQLTISGNSESRVFSVVSGDVTIAHLSIREGLAQGGDGGDSEFGGGGGGGAGFGGGIFVNTGASVLAQNIIFSDNQAVGGNGGDAGVPNAGTSSVAGGFTSTGGTGGTSSFVDGVFGVGGAGGNGTTVDGNAGSNGAQGNFAGGGGGGGGGGFNGSNYSSGSGGDRGLTTDALDGGDPTTVQGVGHGKDGSDGLDNSILDMDDDPIFNPDIPAGTGGGGGGGAGLGGAIFVRTGGSLTVVDSHFEGNQARGGEAGRRGDGRGVGLGGSIFAMDGVTVNHFGTTFGFGLERANSDSRPTLFPSSPATSEERRAGLMGTFSRTLPALTYIDGPAVPEFLEYTYLNPGVRNPFPIDIEDMEGNKIGEDRSGGTTTTVTEILARLGRGGLREEVANPTGIALTSIDNSNGQWELNGVMITGVSETNALLLEGTDELRFIVNEDFATYFRDNQPRITFRSWDGTGGSAGDFVDTTTNGGGTPFSATIATAVLDISDPILFGGPVELFGEASTFTLNTDDFFTRTFASDVYPTNGSPEFDYTIVGVGGIWAAGPSVTSQHATINPARDGSYIYGYSAVRNGVMQFASTSARSTGPGNVSQAIYNANVRIGNFVATGQDSGPIPILRSQTDRDNGITHFKVTNLSGGTLYKDAAFTQAVTDGEFLSYENGNVWLYFRPDPGFTGDVTFLTINSTSDNDSGLDIGDTFIAEGNATDALTITRSNPLATHFKVTGITNGTLFLDAELTQAVTNDTFLKFSSETVTLFFNPDGSLRRGDGAFTVEESTTNADSGLLGSPATTTITIVPQRVISVIDSIIQISSISDTVAERDAGLTTVDFIVSRGNVSGDLPEATFNFQVTSSEVNPDDFAGGVLPSGTVTFAAGQAQAVISIELARDAEIEGDEDFTVTLSGLPMTGFDLSNIASTVTITNDDFPLVVDELGDVDDGDFSVGNRSLREAIRIANLRAGADVITFDAALMGQSILLENGRLEISEDLTIMGLGAGQLTIDAQGNHQIVFIDGRTNGAIDVTISGVTLTGGAANDFGGGTSGAVNNSTRGGAIFNDLGNLVLSETTIDGNTADVNGGGLFNLGGSVSLTGSTLSANSATVHGGGLYNDGTVSISNSTYSANFATANGGGLYDSGVANITNSTFSGNSANNDGGGIYNVDETVVITNATILGNRADADGANGGTGGGVWTFNDAFTFTTLLNSLVAGNVQGADMSDGANDIANKDLEAASASNLIGDPTSSGGLMHGSGSNIVGQDDGGSGRELLDLTSVIETTLQDNGGPTLTHLLSIGSPAVNAGNNDLATTPGDDGIPGTDDTNEMDLTTDQRGTGFNRIIGDSVDIGAVELVLPATLAIVADSANKVEGNSGTTDFTFTVTRGENTTGTTTVDYAITGDVDAADFGGTLPTGTVTFNDGDAQKTITIQVMGDTDVEADESFTVMLSNPSVGASIVTATDTGTIQNDDAATVTLAAVSASQSEGSGGTTTDFTFSVTLNNAVDGGFDIAYTTNDGTATLADGDYVDNDGSLNFTGTAGEMKTITVQVNHDDDVEADELFNVMLGAITNLGSSLDPADVTVAGSPQNGTIQNDDTATVTLAAVNASQSEGSGGTTTDFTFSVTLSNAVDGGFDIAYTTNDGTATLADGDYVDNDGSLNFTGTAGEMKTITVQVNHDHDVEADELFNVALGAITNLDGSLDPADVTVAGSPQNGTIQNDDFITALSIDDVSQEEDTGLLTFTVSLDQMLSTDVMVDFMVVPGSASLNDFTVTSGTATILANTSSTTISVTVTADLIVELDERLFVNLSNIQSSTENVVFGDNQGTGTITNDDSLLVAGTGNGTASDVQARHAPSNTLLFRFSPFGPGFTGGVRVAMGDVNGDGIPDIITGAGPTGGPHIKVFDGTNTDNELMSFFAFDASFQGGVYVAAADLNGDNRADIIVGADEGGGPHVRVFSGSDSSILFDFMAYDSGFMGGVRVAAGDISGDGTPDIITAVGPGGGPHVRVFDGSTPQVGGGIGTDIGGPLGSFFAYPAEFTGGVFVAAGDVDGDLRIDLITGAGAGGGPHVRVFSGSTGSQLPGPIGSFFAFDSAFLGGVRVSASDITRDGLADVIVAAGPGGGPHVRAFDAASSGALPDQVLSFFAADTGVPGGVFATGSVNLESAVPLQLANGFQAAENPSLLTLSDVKPVFDAALARFEALGLPSSATEQLADVTIHVADLNANRLGESLPGVIRLDNNAAGFGWFIDLTPEIDEEFSVADLYAIDPAAAGGVDLLTVLLHELAHELGAEHEENDQSSLMAETLPPGTRRLPKREDFNEVFTNWDRLGDLLD